MKYDAIFLFYFFFVSLRAIAAAFLTRGRQVLHLQYIVETCFGWLNYWSARQLRAPQRVYESQKCWEMAWREDVLHNSERSSHLWDVTMLNCNQLLFFCCMQPGGLRGALVPSAFLCVFSFCSRWWKEQPDQTCVVVVTAQDLVFKYLERLEGRKRSPVGWEISVICCFL